MERKGMAADLKYIELCAAMKIAKITKDDKIVVENNTSGTNEMKPLKVF
jgi:hypothetical protein